MGKNKFLKGLILSLLSGFLFWVAWPPKSPAYLAFIAFVPLLLAEKIISADENRNNSMVFFTVSMIAFLLWNYLSTFWIHYATFTGAIATVILNALLMSMPLMLYHKIRQKTKRGIAYIALPIFWLGFEYLHLNWDLAWPWMTIGNVFAMHPAWIQWYEYTGTMGGTIWVWVVNLVIFNLCEYFIDNDYQFRQKRVVVIALSLTLVILLLPVIISKNLNIHESRPSGKNVVIVQPNIDPYNEKFAEGSFINQINKMIRLSESAVDQNTVLIVWPETAISNSIDEKQLNFNIAIVNIRAFLKRHAGLKLLTGLDSYKFFKKGEKVSATARLYEPDSNYFDFHNSALLLDSSQHFDIYYKSRLVPGVEKMPYPGFFKFLEKYAIKLGGTSGSLGMQEKPSVFKIDKNIVAAPAICYESVFGDYLGRFVMLGANVLVVMTNDGWWRDTDGYKQHFSYASLRAIELRKDVIRSANTGISAYINSKGRVVEKTGFWETATIKRDICINDTLTFYARNGDYPGRIASFISILLILWLILLSVFKRKR